MKKRLLLLFFCSCISLCVHAQWYTIGADVDEYVIGFETYKDTIVSYAFGTPYLLRQMGSTWENWQVPLPNSNGIHNVAVVDDVLFVVPYTTTNTAYVYYWENGAWKTLGEGFKNVNSSNPPNLYDIIFHDGHLYVCGEFNRIGNEIVNGVARWDITHWSPLGAGVSGIMAPYNLVYPHDLTVFNNELIVCGNFERAGDIDVNGIAAWNGNSWHSFGQGFNKAVYGAEVHEGLLYACGEFTNTANGDIVLGYVAKWDIEEGGWLYPGFKVAPAPNESFCYAHTLRSLNKHLYILGGFDVVEDDFNSYAGGGVARWDGQSIDALYGGVTNPSDAEAIYPYQGGMLVGGDFSMAGNTAVNGIAFLYDDATTFVSPFVTSLVPLQHPFVYYNGGLHWNESSKAMRFSISDLNGKQVMAGDIGLENYISLVHLPAGVYFVQTFVDNELPRVYRIIHQ